MKFDIIENYKIVDKDENNYYDSLNNYFESENYFKFNENINYDFFSVDGVRLA